MSVKIMGLVWDLDNEAIARDEKYILLAYADHADHLGKNIYPSVDTIAKKTGYKERATQMITRKLSKNGFLVPDGKGSRGTNRWFIPLDKEGVRIAPANFAPPQNPAKGGAKPTGEGVHADAPEPSEPSSEPSKKIGTQKPLKASQIPELVLVREVTCRYPPEILFDDIVQIVRNISERLGREVTVDDLLKFYKPWRFKGYNKTNFGWLEWAETGSIPQNWTWKSSKIDRSRHALESVVVEDL